MNDLSLADVAALRGDGENGGWGSGWWIILLFILIGGWGNNGFGNNGAAGGNELYPWINQSEQVSNGFRDQMLNTGINGIQQGMTAGFANAANQLCNSCAEMQMGMMNGFFGVEQAANARQVANMQQGFANQTTMLQGFNAMQAQQAQCCCDNQLAMANQTATILAEHCSDRAALSDGIRDVIAAQMAGTQRIIDQMCQDKIDAKNEEIQQLRTQLQVQNLAASQTAQTAAILANNEAQTSTLEKYLAPVPIPAYVVPNPNAPTTTTNA